MMGTAGNFDVEAAALQYFQEGFNCAESVFKAGIAAYELPEAPAAATGFGGGIGRRGYMCGALTGAVMALGLYNRRVSPDQKELYRAVMEKTAALLSQFEKEFGSVNCSVLTGYDLTDPEQMKKFVQDQVRKEKCERFVAAAGRQLAGVIEAGSEN